MHTSVLFDVGRPPPIHALRRDDASYRASTSADRLHELVVQAEYQERRRPLTDEATLTLSSREFQRQRQAHGAERAGQEPMRGDLRGLLLDHAREIALGMFWPHDWRCDRVSDASAAGLTSSSDMEIPDASRAPRFAYVGNASDACLPATRRNPKAATDAMELTSQRVDVTFTLQTTRGWFR